MKPLVEAEYRDQAGSMRHAPASTLRALDAAFTRDDWDDRLPPVVIRSAGRETAIPIHAALRASQPNAWTIHLEQGGAREGSIEARREFIACGALPDGYHTLTFRYADGKTDEVLLIIAPQKAFLPPLLKGGARLFGIAAQLYALRSARNWGIGDFTDLADLISRAAAAGAALVGINPLHALSLARPELASPYSPSSRDFLNPLYLDPEAIADFVECEPARRVRQSPELNEILAALRAAPLVDYAGVAEQKLSILQLLHRSFREVHLGREMSARGLAFRAFQKERGEALRLFCIFQALEDHLARDGGAAAWTSWPKEYQDPVSPAVQAFARANELAIEFYAYLQWQAFLQLSECALRAKSAGMPIGIYLDVAVGIDRDAAVLWANPPAWVLGWSIGAPPDSWNSLGQNWGLPPPHPIRMRMTRYSGFRALLQANMSAAGALRLDHILGLMRLFWIPQGARADAGAYVHYPFEDLLAVVVLESHRQRCMIVGEDLGTVPEGFSAALNEAGILSYRLLYFERERDGGFTRPADWNPMALAAVTTHDLPTLSGYWTEADLALKAELALIEGGTQKSRLKAQRAADRAALRHALAREGLEGNAIPTEAAYRFLARSRSLVVMVQIEDLIGVREQANMPGTVFEHPNWRRKLPLELPAVFSHETAMAVLDAMRELRPGSAPRMPQDEALRVPTALYRLQFGAGFTFRDATVLVPYLSALGISHVYASPYLKARPGSTHGYDITDHNAFNPQVGTPAEFDLFCEALRRHNMGQILDFIPNHMGIGKADNSLWLDVLEWGRESPFADFFDINWAPRQEALRGRILVPVLGDHYGVALEKGEIVLKFDATTGHLNFWYHDHCFPLHPRHYARVLLGAGAENAPAASVGLLEGFSALARLPVGAETARTEAARLKQDLARLCAEDPVVLSFAETRAADFAGVPGDSAGFVPLHTLLEAQRYRLAYWRVAADEVNFRRFFDITDLAGLRMENPDVFAHTHQLIGRLIEEGKLQGLRLDHLDGLFDPAAYLARLQDFAAGKLHLGSEPSDPFYVVVEKILASHERLRETWPVAGTTGYEFINLLTGLQIDPRGERPLDRSYRRLAGSDGTFADILYACKRLVMETILPGELNALAAELDRLSEQDWSTRDFTLERLRAALREIAAGFPVYRTYVGPEGVAGEDRRYIDWAVAQARKTYAGPDPEILDFVHAALSMDLCQQSDAYERDDALRFAMKFQQYTSPVTAKSLEDTAFYRYVRLLCLNEVGSDATRFGVSVTAFHHAMNERAKSWPRAVSSTATHDTKRGEDARARLAVLSEMAPEWEMHALRWTSLNRFRRHDLGDISAPAPLHEYLVYQTLLGAWPPGGLAEGDADRLRARVREASLKAMRESKWLTSWTNPNADYESAALDFVDKILDDTKSNPFLEDFRGFVERLAPFGMLNSLSQTVLKLTAPGIPDIYQGCELWDHSMVDPDNRRPVDFSARAAMLTELSEPSDGARREWYRRMLSEWPDGRIKLAILAPLLRLRREKRALFQSGSYEPLEIEGPQADRALAFLRRQEGHVCLICVGRLYVSLADGAKTPYAPATWRGTRIVLPGGLRATDVFTGRICETAAKGLPLDQLLADLPVSVALLHDQRI